jgi:hypothetical protein
VKEAVDTIRAIKGNRGVTKEAFKQQNAKEVLILRQVFQRLTSERDNPRDRCRAIGATLHATFVIGDL